MSLSGFEGFDSEGEFPVTSTAGGPTLDLIGVEVQQRGRRRMAIATFTPPGSFPFRFDDRAHLFQRIKVNLAPSGEPPWVGIPLMLVRPPVLLTHGLIGSELAFASTYADEFYPSFIVDFVDYALESLSGYDRIFTAVPEHIERLLSGLREGRDLHVPGRRGPLGRHLYDVVGRKIAATRLDVVAHSMGGLATRWFITEDIASRAPEPRTIDYPSSSGLGSVDGIGFAAIQTARAHDKRYRRTTNFMRGSIRKVITQGSPQMGSPIANFMIHDVARDDRSVFTDTLRFSIILGVMQLVDFVPPGAQLSPGFANALYDLSIGSSANRVIQETASPPVPVHAIASTKPGFVGVGSLAAVEGALRSLAILMNPTTPILSFNRFNDYCPGFGASTSDLIVPLHSATYGVSIANSTQRAGYNHLELNQKPEIAQIISSGLLYDEPANPIMNNVDPTFPNGQPVPLECN